MMPLPILLELQSIHDGLRTIHRDLTSFPPDMAGLDAEVKALAKRLEKADKEHAELDVTRTRLEKELAVAQRLEAHARTALKGTTQKIQYTAAIRELDERERQRSAVARPLKETEAKLEALSSERASLREQHADTLARFQELHEIFLSEHENQVVGQGRLELRRGELEAALDPSLVARFNRLIESRQGRAVASVEAGACTGCHTKLRNPFLNQLREQKMLPCESCQRLLYLPAQA